jgi:hypothetical protein
MIKKLKNSKKQKLKIMEKGMSLIELILYVAIFMIFISGVVTVGIEVVGLRAKSRVQQEVIFNNRLVTKRIALEIRNASAINSVSAESISLANTDSVRNPTVIAKSGNRMTIAWGASAPCPTTSPCFLTSSKVSVDSLMFTNMSDLGGNSESIKYAITTSSINNGGSKDWWYSQSLTGNSEIRSK